MRIDGPGASDPVNKLKKKSNVKGSGGDFGSFLSAAEETEETSATAAVSDISNVSALLSLQEMGGQGEVNAKAYKHGEDILEQLNELRMGLLSGMIPPQKLHNLARLVKETQSEIVDPKLQDILKDIEIRALVELEKFNQAQKKGK